MRQSEHRIRATEGYEVGGILGINKYLQDEHSFNGTVLNTVFSGHIDGTKASSAGGIVGSTDKEPCILCNNLFLGYDEAQRQIQDRYRMWASRWTFHEQLL